MALSYNKGEWSELYAFIKLLKEGRVFAADQYANRIDNQFLPIIRIIREESPKIKSDYYTGEKIRIYQNGIYVTDIDSTLFDNNIKLLFNSIFNNVSRDGAFEIPTIQPFMDRLKVKKVKASSDEKVDIEMQIQDIHTGFFPEVGFSIKSDVGAPPTLLNSSKATGFRYQLNGISDKQAEEINSIDKNQSNNYMIARMEKILQYTRDIKYESMISQTYEDNLILIDTMLPEIYGELILQHYMHIKDKVCDCVDLVNLLADENPLRYRRTDNYSFKFKKLLSAAALGMQPSKVWDGRDSATGGYLIIKRDGDVLCYHLYNRNFFEDYLLNNTKIDRPSASRHDFRHIYDLNGHKYIDLNVQVRFKPIKNNKKRAV